MMTLTVEYYFTHPQDKLGMYASDPRIIAVSMAMNLPNW